MSVLGLTLLAASAAPPAEVEHDPPPPGAVARIGNTRLRVVASSVHLSADGKEVILAGPESVRVLDPATGKTVATIPVPGATNLYGLDLDPKSGRLTLYGHTTPDGERGDDDLALWSVDIPGREVVGQPVRLPPVGDDRVWRLSATPGGSRVVGSTRRALRVWDGRTGEAVAATPRRGWSEGLAVGPDGPVVACGLIMPAVLWDWRAEGPPKTLAIPAKFVPTAAAVGPGGRAYVGGGDQVFVYDAKTGERRTVLAVGGPVRRLAPSPDGKTLAVAYDPGQPISEFVTLWDVTTGKEVRRLAVGRGHSVYLAWSADGSRLAAKSSRLWVWDAKTGELVTPPPTGHEGSVYAVAFAADGRLVTGGTDATVRVWDPRTGQPATPRPLTAANSVRAVAVSPDGNLVAATSQGNDLRVWDAKTGEVRHTLPGNGRTGGLEPLGFSPDGKRLVTWGRTSLRLRVWDTTTGKPVAESRTLPDGVTDWQDDDPRADVGTVWVSPFALSTDAARFAARFGQEVRVFDTTTGKERVRFDISAIGVGSLAFSPDGKRLAGTGHGAATTVKLPDGTEKHLQAEVHPLTVWDLEANKPAWQETTSGPHADAVAFSPDGRLVAEMTELAGVGPVVQWRDAATGKEGGRITIAPYQRVVGLRFAFDPAGKRVAVPLLDGTVAIYELTEGKKK